MKIEKLDVVNGPVGDARSSSMLAERTEACKGLGHTIWRRPFPGH